MNTSTKEKALNLSRWKGLVAWWSDFVNVMDYDPHEITDSKFRQLNQELEKLELRIRVLEECDQ